MHVLKVGHLVAFTVCKAWPEASALLVWIEPQGPFGLLPRAEADRAYKIGDTGFAAVQQVAVPYPRLSQRTIHYIRRIAELILSPVRTEGRLAVSRVAYRAGWPWAKLLVRLASPEALKEALSLLPQARAHTSTKLVLVPKEEDLLRQVQAALYPAPADAIAAIRPGPDDRPRSLIVEIAPEARGRILGPQGLNLRAAELLIRRRLVLMDALAPAPRGNTCQRSASLAVGAAE